MPTKALIKIPVVQERLGGVSRSTVNRLVDAGKLTRVKLGASAFITAESLDKLLQSITAA